MFVMVAFESVTKIFLLVKKDEYTENLSSQHVNCFSGYTWLFFFLFIMFAKTQNNGPLPRPKGVTEQGALNLST